MSERVVMYFSCINLRTGKVTHEEDPISDWPTMDDYGFSYPDESMEIVKRQKSGVWLLGLDPYAPHSEDGEERLCCFSIHSFFESLALCVDEYSLCHQMGMAAYCKRVRAISWATVEWDEDADGEDSTDQVAFEFDWAQFDTAA